MPQARKATLLSPYRSTMLPARWRACHKWSMTAAERPETSSAPLPARADVVIIGGGIVGVSAALYLAKKGVSVALCEKGRIAGEQSSRNWGWCRTMGRDEAEIPLAIESLRLWEHMNKEVGAETGFRNAGIVYLCESQSAIEQYEAWLARARQLQVASRLLSATKSTSFFPARPDAGRALCSRRPTAGRSRNWRLPRSRRLRSGRARRS
jgi:glycine/D-amino acid oxidase-like deaminating enzyme